MQIEGRLEEIEETFAWGWAWSPTDTSQRLVITILVGGRRVAAGVADLPRPSLHRAGIADDAHGFRIALPAKALADPAAIRSMVALAGSEGTSLTRSPSFPGAGYDIGASAVATTTGVTSVALGLPPSVAGQTKEHTVAAGEHRLRPGPRVKGPIPSVLLGFVDAVGSWLPLAVIVFAGIVLVWTRLLAASQGLGNDELYSVTRYITPGPSAIWGTYIPNDHVLFELLGWITVELTGLHGNDAYRLWSVVPGIGGVALMSWWLARRLDLWYAAIFAVLAAASPVHLTLTTSARGYGLGFLAGAMLVIGAAELNGSNPRRARVVFAVGALIGIWTLPSFAVPVIVVTAIVLCSRVSPRPVLLIGLGVGIASLIFYAPLIGGIVSSTHQNFGGPLPWYGFATSPLADNVVPGLSLLTGATTHELSTSIADISYIHPRSAIVIAIVMAVGAGVLCRRGERMLASILGLTPFVTYLIYELSRVDVEPRFGSFLLLPMLALTAIGLVGPARRIAGTSRAAAAVLASAAVALTLILAVKLERDADYQTQVPLSSTATASAILSDTGFAEPIITNTDRPLGFDYYLGGQHYQEMAGGAFVTMLCGRHAAFIYLQFVVPAPHTPCLQRQAEAHITVPAQGFDQPVIWFVRRN